MLVSKLCEASPRHHQRRRGQLMDAWLIV